MSILVPYRFIEKLKSLSYVEAIYIYGSRARDEHSPRSDLDIAISCPQANRMEWQTILDIIDDADTLLPIDLIRLDTLEDGKLKENIERDKKLLYRKGEAYGEK